MNKQKNPAVAAAEKGKKAVVLGRIAKYFTAAVVVLVLFWFGFTYVVREGECTVVTRFGAVRAETSEAGLYMKLPWPFEKVVTYDDRLQYLETSRLETTTKDKRNIILQSSVVFEIENPVLYHNSIGAGGSKESYLNDQVFSATNSVLGTYDLTALVSIEQEKIKIGEIQQEIFARVAAVCEANYGLRVVDVSILRISLPDENLESVFAQMRADRQKEIDLIMANATMEANKITSEADAKAAETVAKGEEAAAEIRKQAEVEVAGIYAAAQKANIELFKFLKNLDAVVASVNNSTVLVVDENTYPFNILTEYSKHMVVEGDKTVINDLSYILTQLNETDRKALVSALETLITEYQAKLPQAGG